jgi:hypothetical protein
MWQSQRYQITKTNGNYTTEFHAFFISFVLQVLKDVLKLRGKGLKKSPHSISSKFGSNILLLLLCSRKSTRMLRIGKCLTLDFDLVFFTVIILEYTNIFTVYYYLCSYASKQNEYV